MANMKGKVFAVTGASSGIGARIAETAGAAGAHVFLCGRTADTMARSKAKIEAVGGGATIMTFDITDEAALRAFVDAAAHDHGLDVFVNNAGLGYIQERITDGDPAHWREMLDVNVYALLVGCQQAVKVMRAGGHPGRIINISSFAAKRRESGVYGATKHAVNVITSTLREELQEDDIRVTSVMPGPYATNFARNLNPQTITAMAKMLGLDMVVRPGDKLPDEVQQKIQAAMSRQIGDVQVIADAVMYIAALPSDVGIDEIVIRPPKNQAF